MKKYGLLIFFPIFWAPLLMGGTLTVQDSALTVSNATLIFGDNGVASVSASGPVLVQSSCTASVNTTTLALTLSGIAVGNTLFGMYADTGEGFVSLSDGTNTYTDWNGGGSSNGSARDIIYVSTNVGSGGTKTLTVTAGTGAALNGCIGEISGVTVHDTQKTASTTGTNPTSGNYTTGGTTDLCLGILSHSSSGTPLTPGANQTQIGEDENNTTHQTYNAEYSTPASGTNSSAWTSSSVAYVIDVTCLK